MSMIVPLSLCAFCGCFFDDLVGVYVLVSISLK